MKIFIIIGIIFLTTSLSLAGKDDILTKNIETSIISKSGGYTTISIKLEAMNYGPAAKVFIKVRAVDSNNFELHTIQFGETFQKYDTKKLTNTAFIKASIADKIRQWEICEIKVYEN
jgi:hypothetical protein